MGRKIYLDTSFCSSAGRALSILTEDVRAELPEIEVCTSMLTLVELLPGSEVNEKNYTRRRSAIRAIEDAGVNVRWRMPESAFVGAFDWMHQTYKMTEERDLWVGELARIVRDSETAKEYSEAVREPRLARRLKILREYDDKFAAGLAKVSRDGYKLAREGFERATPEERQEVEQLGLGLYTGPSFLGFVKSLISTQATVSFTRLGMAKLALGLCGLDQEDDALLEKTYESYNSSTLLFLHVVTRRLDADLLNGTNPGRNDALDACHFLYMEPGDILATTDKKMAAMAEALGLRVIGAEAIGVLRERARSKEGETSKGSA